MSEQREPLATPQEVAAYRRTTVGALAAERHRGEGPPYLKSKSRVYYKWSEVDAWMDATFTTVAGKAG